MANLYERYILPRVIHHVCGLSPMSKQREKVVPDAHGVVLELGVGSGHNLKYYNASQVKHVIGIDPTPDASKLSQAKEKSDISFELIKESAEVLPVADESIDTVVCTYVLCTIPDVHQALSECRRVLKKDGRLLFVEHGLAPDKGVQKTQNRINGIWKKVAGGCHLNRDISSIISSSGFEITDHDTMYLPGWKPATWNIWGQAQTV